MTLRQRYDSIIGYFRDNVPVAESELHFDSPFQLLVAVMLCTRLEEIIHVCLHGVDDPRLLFELCAFIIEPLLLLK